MTIWKLSLRRCLRCLTENAYTTLYHPQSDGMVECLDRTLTSTLVHFCERPSQRLGCAFALHYVSLPQFSKWNYRLDTKHDVWKGSTYSLWSPVWDLKSRRHPIRNGCGNCRKCLEMLTCKLEIRWTSQWLNMRTLSWPQIKMEAI